uniref:Uncharacterized protein n=1 Tax=Glossina austeni TaxID=7395 RepID=A0A1A9V1H8_GLOAU
MNERTNERTNDVLMHGHFIEGSRIHHNHRKLYSSDDDDDDVDDDVDDAICSFCCCIIMCFSATTAIILDLSMCATCSNTKRNVGTNLFLISMNDIFDLIIMKEYCVLLLKPHAIFMFSNSLRGGYVLHAHVNDAPKIAQKPEQPGYPATTMGVLLSNPPNKQQMTVGIKQEVFVLLKCLHTYTQQHCHSTIEKTLKAELLSYIVI